MKSIGKYIKKLRKNSGDFLQFNSNLLSVKSTFRLALKRKKEHTDFAYPLLISSGLQRSGTHLFANLLRNHHQVLSYFDELQIGRPNKYHWPDLKDEKKIKKRFNSLIPRNLARKYLTLSAYGKTKLAYETFIFDYRIFRNIFFELEKNNERFIQRNTLNNFFTAYFNAYLNCNHSNFYNQYKYIVAPVPGLTIIEKSIIDFFIDYPDGKVFALIREPFIWWNSAQKHTRNLNKNGLERYRKTLSTVNWACKEYKNSLFVVSFDHLIKNTEGSMNLVLEKAGLELNKIATYPSNFPLYANDNSTFGHKKTKEVSKEKVKRDIVISADDKTYIKKNISSLYEEALESYAINLKIAS